MVALALTFHRNTDAYVLQDTTVCSVSLDNLNARMDPVLRGPCARICQESEPSTACAALGMKALLAMSPSTLALLETTLVSTVLPACLCCKGDTNVFVLLV